MATLLSMRAYAKHRGVSTEAVSKAVKRGRISTTRDENGMRKINPEVADREWAANSDPAKYRSHYAASLAALNAPAAPAAEQASDDADSESASPTQNSYSRSRAVREAINARLAKLQLDEKSGKLVDSEGVKKEYFALGRLVRDNLLNIPDRIAAELAAETNQFVVHKTLTAEIRRVLEELKLKEDA